MTEPAASSDALATRGRALIGIGIGVALLLGPGPIAVGILLAESAPAVASALIALGVAAMAGGIVLMVLGMLRLRRRAAVAAGAGTPLSGPRPALPTSQIVAGSLLLLVGVVGLVLAGLAASIESPSIPMVVSAWILAIAGLAGGAGTVLAGAVGLAASRRRGRS